jgi:cytochrome P450
VSLDAPDHSPLRSILTPLFTPSRLKEIERNLRAIADKLIDRFAPSGHLEVIGQYGKPFSGMAIVELLGVPEKDLSWFDDKFSGHLPRFDEKGVDHDVFRAVAPKFAEYTMDLRANPRPGVLTELATTRFPDGSLPSVDQVAMLAAFLFTAGQDTTARLLGTALQVIAEQPDLQSRLRADRSLIPDFVEEALRFDGPVKTSNRLVRKTTSLGSVRLQAGTTVSLLNGAMNRDPRRFDAPSEFRLGRPKPKEHLAFGRGPHTCIGAPLARIETVVSINRLLDRLSNIRINEEKHGPPRPGRFHHEQTYILRGHVALHVIFDALTPAFG